MGRGIERCASSLLGVVIHSTFQRPCSIGNCGKDERHTTAVLSRIAAPRATNHISRDRRFPILPRDVKEREGLCIFKSPDKCIE